MAEAGRNAFESTERSDAKKPSARVVIPVLPPPAGRARAFCHCGKTATCTGKKTGIGGSCACSRVLLFPGAPRRMFCTSACGCTWNLSTAAGFRRCHNRPPPSLPFLIYWPDGYKLPTTLAEWQSNSNFDSLTEEVKAKARAENEANEKAAKARLLQH